MIVIVVGLGVAVFFWFVVATVTRARTTAKWWSSDPVHEWQVFFRDADRKAKTNGRKNGSATR